jgi:hypothetical protein
MSEDVEKNPSLHAKMPKVGYAETGEVPRLDNDEDECAGHLSRCCESLSRAAEAVDNRDAREAYLDQGCSHHDVHRNARSPVVVAKELWPARSADRRRNWRGVGAHLHGMGEMASRYEKAAIRSALLELSDIKKCEKEQGNDLLDGVLPYTR